MADTPQAGEPQVVNTLYRERAALVAYLASQYPAVIAYADAAQPEWPVVYIETPAGQVSWHLSVDDLDLFKYVERVQPDDLRAKWDRHSTDEKYERIATLAVPAPTVDREPKHEQLRAAYDLLRSDASPLPKYTSNALVWLLGAELGGDIDPFGWAPGAWEEVRRRVAREILAAPAPVVDREGLTGDVVTEHAIEMSDGSMQVRNPGEHIERIYPLADWIPAHQRFGGKVWRRRIRVVEDWVEEPKGGGD